MTKNDSRWLLTLVFFLVACAPKVSERVFEPAENSFESEDQDVRLNLRLREYGEAPPDIEWSQTVPAATYFNQAENLVVLGEQTRRPELSQKGLAWIRTFYRSPGAAPMTNLSDGPFMNLVAAHSQTEVRGRLGEVLVEMDQALPMVLRRVQNIEKKLPPNSRPGLEGLLLQAETFNRLLVADIPQMKMSKTIQEGFKKELILTTDSLFASLRILIRDIEAATTLSGSLAPINVAMGTFQIDLDPALAASLESGKKISAEIDTMTDAQGALTVIVDIWRLLSPQERIDNFKGANEDLYNFLYKKNEKELECLRQRDCLGGPVDGIVKSLFVLPKIESYGVARIQSEINLKTLTYVKALLAAFATRSIALVPQMFVDSISVNWKAKASRIGAVRDDLQKYVQRVSGAWAKKILPETAGTVPGFEASAVEVRVTRSLPLAIRAKFDGAQLRGDVAGSALAANYQFLKNAEPRDPMAFLTAFSQINKIVAISGFRNTKDQLVPGLLAPVSHRGKYLDIANFESTRDLNYSFQIPNIAPLKDGLRFDPSVSYQRNFSAFSFAEQIRGLSQLLRFTADWKLSSYDRILGSIRVQDVVNQDAQDSALEQPLFPKDGIFALNIGTVSVLLKNLTKKITPVFFWTLDNKLIWADQYAVDSQDTPVMAGIVDIAGGERAKIVRSEDVAQFILAIEEFMSALDGVENTRSAVLLKMNPRGTRPVDTLVAAKKDLRRLVIAMANLLATKMRTAQSHIKSSHTLDPKNEIDDRIIKVETQASAIRALIKAYQLTGIQSYIWTARSLYFSMNRNLYRVKSEFYVNSDGSELSFSEKLNTLRAVSELRPYLPETSRVQAQKLIAPWLDAIGLLQSSAPNVSY